MNNQQTLRDIVNSYGKRISFAYLFGSQARGEATAASDLDIAIHCADADPGSRFALKLDLNADLCRALGRNDVDILILNTAPTLLQEEVVRYGILLYAHDPAALIEYETNIIHRAIDFKTQRLAVMGA